MLNSRGTTIFLTTHYIEEAESLCDRVAIINHGKLVAIGTVDELRDIIGKVAVDTTDDNGKRMVRYFDTREAAKDFSSTLGERMFNLRKTTLEDVFLEITGESGGKLQ